MPENKDKNTENNPQESPKKRSWLSFILSSLFSFVKYTILGLVLVLVSLLVLLQFTFFQTLIVQRAFSEFSEQLGFELKVHSVSINFFQSKALFERVSVRDPQDQQMIFAEALEVDFNYADVYKNRQVLLEKVVLSRGVISLITDKKTENLNITEFIDRINELTASENPDPDKPPVRVWLKKVKIKDSYFGLDDMRKPYSEEPGIDFSHFGIDELSADLNDLLIAGDTIQSKINYLKGIEPNVKFRVKQLRTFFQMTDANMDFRNLLLRAGNSTIQDNIFFKYKSKRDLSDFVEKVNIVAYLDSTTIHTDDLAHFAPAVKEFNDTWRFSGTMRGKVSDFIIDEFDFRFGLWSQVQGRVEMSGLPNFNETLMQLDLHESKILSRELVNYVPQPDIYELLQKFGIILFQANFTGFPSDFVANGSFETMIGNIDSDLKMNLKENRSQSYYKGKLSTQRLDLGRLFDASDYVGTIDMNGSIEGYGFSPETARFDLDAQIKELAFNKYVYHDIQVDGKLSQKSFDGKLIANDPNFDLEIDGILDFNKQKDASDLPMGRFDLETTVRRISLQPLNFSPDETIIQGKLDLDTYGITLDSLVGEVTLSDASFIYKGKGLEVNRADILSFKSDEQKRFFQLNSEFLDFQINGDFTFSQLTQDIQELFQEYLLTIQNDQEKIAEYYEAKNQKTFKNYSTDFYVDFKNIGAILALFADTKGFYVSKYAQLKGKFNKGKATAFTLYSEDNIDSLIYDNYKFYDLKIDLNTSKIANNSNILASGLIQSSRQVIGKAETENLNLDIYWGENLINFDISINQSRSNNFANLVGSMQFLGDTTLIVFKPSNFKFLEEEWKISRDNKIVLYKRALSIEQLIFFNTLNPSSLISLNGAISQRDSLQQSLNLKVQDVNIYPFANFVNLDVQGLLNAKLDLEEIFTNPDANGSLSLENLIYDNVLIGDLDGKAKWNNLQQKLEIDVDVYRRRKYMLELVGSYFPYNQKNSLDLKAKLNRTDIEIFQPFLRELVSNLRGTLDGVLDISGTIEFPLVLGNAFIKNGRFRMDYLNTTYDLEGEVLFLADQIKSRNALLFDQNNNPAQLNATFFHDGFKNIYLEMAASFYNFQMLNTNSKQNSLFYGTAFATGDLSIEGFLNNLQMDIKAKSKKGTKISLPLDGYEEVAQNDFIQFVRPARSDSSEVPDTAIQKIDLGGLKLNFNLDVTQDAEFEIIFDQKAGDIIRGNGHGNIKMEVDTEGDFSILGFYTIDKGKYNFTFANLVNKGFSIEKGSTISFNGDIYESQLDIQARYSKAVPLDPLIDMGAVSDPDNPEYRRVYPVSALLKMQGVFLNPEISLGLDLEEAKKTPNTLLRTSVLQLDNKIQGDEQERNRQVFSLLILNRLSPENSFRGAGVGGTAGNSLSELLSNQFSNWISQVDDNLELSFDLDPSDFNSFQLRLSYRLLDGRLRITRDGGFTNYQNQADFASVVGDWTIEYLLSPGGKYRIKMYNRTNQNILNNINLNNSTSTTAGISLLHTASFNNFKDLFQSNRKRDIEVIDEIFKKEPEDTKELLANEPDFSKGSSLAGLEKPTTKKLLLDLPHRYDSIAVGQLRYKAKDTRLLAEENPATKKRNPLEIKKQYLEGDEDNDPIPDWYLQPGEKKALQELISLSEQENSNDNTRQTSAANVKKIPITCPLPHRFDDYRQRVKIKKIKFKKSSPNGR